MLATGLAALAGYVDAMGYLSLHGFFVSFMSGNSTRMAVGLAQASPNAGVAAGLIGTFVLGVILGSLTGHVAKTRRRPVVLALVTILLAVAASFGMTGTVRWAVVAMVLAMGAENAVFERNGEVHIGVTYMTGTLVKLGQRITGAMLGQARFAWAPYLMLWLGLVVGAVSGAFVYPYLGLSGLWISVAAAVILTCVAALVCPE